MTNPHRRSVLKGIGASAVGLAGVQTALGHGGDEDDDGDDDDGDSTKGQISKIGHSLLSDPPGAYAEESVRDDGRYAVLGGFLGPVGSFLVDLREPDEPTEVHHVGSPSEGTRHADVKFDPRDGIYYRTLEGENEGTEVIDYGYTDGTPEDPVIHARIDSGPTHNVFPHPEEPLLYTVNEHNGTSAMEIWSVTDPCEPELVGEVGPTGGLHDFVVDAERDLGHAAFISDAFDDFDPDRDFAGYAVYDMSDPWNPSVLGTFDYAAAPDYEEVGEEGFERCHYADYDPHRELAYVGDEIATGVPGGKHVFDISDPTDPVSIGFTVSPNAELMDEENEAFDWTGHNFDVVRKCDTTMLVSGDYHEGTVVYDVTNPTDPTPTDQYRTDDRADEVNPPIFELGEAPMAWGADYNERRNLVVTSDMFTGIYTFKVEPNPAKGKKKRKKGEE